MALSVMKEELRRFNKDFYMNYKLTNGLRNRGNRNAAKQRTLYQGGFITVLSH